MHVSGRSSSPLEAMTIRSTVPIGAVILLLALAWVLVPPFPSPSELIDKSRQALTTQLGSSHEVAMLVPEPLRSKIRGWKTIGWEKSRGIAIWELEATWTRTPDDPLSLPDMVSRCLHLRWAPDPASFFLPCDTVMRGWVMASNNRWRGP